MRDLSSLTHEEALGIIAQVIAIAYLDESGDGGRLNPDRELAGADVVDELLGVLDDHGLRPEWACSADVLRPYLTPS
jgi:hypothetical protein